MSDADTIRRIGAALYGDQWQGAMARETGISRTVIHDIARGKLALKSGLLALLRDIARARQVAIDDWLSDTEPQRCSAAQPR